MTRRVAAEAADQEEDTERDREQKDGERGCTARIARVQPLEDVERGDLRLEWEVPRDQDHGSELADGARECKRNAGEERRQQVREDDAAEDREAPGAERRRRF